MVDALYVERSLWTSSWLLSYFLLKLLNTLVKLFSGFSYLSPALSYPITYYSIYTKYCEYDVDRRFSQIRQNLLERIYTNRARGPANYSTCTLKNHGWVGYAQKQLRELPRLLMTGTMVNALSVVTVWLFLVAVVDVVAWFVFCKFLDLCCFVRLLSRV